MSEVQGKRLPPQRCSMIGKPSPVDNSLAADVARAQRAKPQSNRAEDLRGRVRELEEALQGLLEAIGWPQETDEDCEYVDERVDAARAVLGNVTR